MRRGALLCVLLTIAVFFSACGQTVNVSAQPIFGRSAATGHSSGDAGSEKTVVDRKVTALLGDLNEGVSKKVRHELRMLVEKADADLRDREAKGDFVMTDGQYERWENITALLDTETIRQFGKDKYEEEKPDPKLDYGKDTMANLKSTLSGGDWKKLNEMRNEYFAAMESDDESYDTDFEQEIRKITNKYSTLDTDAVVLNLLDAKNQKNLGMYKILPGIEAVYQPGSENGLKTLTAEEKKEMERVWKAVNDILPKDLFVGFQYFKVGGDGLDGTYAYVIPVDKAGQYWCLAVDPADVTDEGLFPYTAVHEMMHYLTLNDKQVKYYNGTLEYYPESRYSDYECVAEKNSYLQKFYEKFWKDIINDFLVDPENPYFYLRHQSEFATAYSSTNCAEDLAEAFSGYVFLEKAPNEAVQAKFDFFDSYPEFRKLKEDILQKVKDNKVYVNPEIEPAYEEEKAA